MLQRLILILSIVLSQLATPGFGFAADVSSDAVTDQQAMNGCCNDACQCPPDRCPCLVKAPLPGENDPIQPLPNEQTTSRAPLPALMTHQPGFAGPGGFELSSQFPTHLFGLPGGTAHQRRAWLCTWLT